MFPQRADGKVAVNLLSSLTQLLQLFWFTPLKQLAC